MTDFERRQESINTIIMAIGELKNTANTTHETVKELSNRVGIQNGRVGKLEKWQAFIQGAVAIICIFIIPVAIKILADVFQRGLK